MSFEYHCTNVFNAEETKALQQLARDLELSEEATIKAALRHFQMHTKRIQDGETCTYSGDADRAALVLGTGSYGRDFVK